MHTLRTTEVPYGPRESTLWTTEEYPMDHGGYPMYTQVDTPMYTQVDTPMYTPVCTPGMYTPVYTPCTLPGIPWCTTRLCTDVSILATTKRRVPGLNPEIS